MRSWHAVALALLFALGACTAAIPPAAPAPEQPANVAIIDNSAAGAAPKWLPAYETAAEQANRGLFDQYDDFRLANKQWYARTVPPPAGQFRAMAEWEAMGEVWTTYSAGSPSNKPVRRMFAEQSIQFAKAGKVRVIVPSTVESADFAAALLQYGMKQADIDAKVQFVVLPNNAIWHIDYGPLPMIDKNDSHLAFTDFVYYKNRPLDDAVPTRLAQEYFKTVTTYRMPFAFEGGNFQADGLGTCATSQRALKNTGYSELKVKSLLKQYAGCDKVVIMKDITDDGTGHIDMFFKWLGPDSVMVGEYVAKLPVDWPGVGPVTVTMPDSVAQELSSDFNVPYQQVWADNQQRLDDNAALWAAMTAPNGKKYTVYRLAMMTRFKDSYGDLPRTFVNSTLFNGINVFPSYALSSCRDPFGKACTDDLGCSAGNHCAAGKCTAGPVSEGCDELVACSNGQECAADPLKKALEAKVYGQWQQALPAYTHVGLRADTIALWSGAIHCITRTIPQKFMQKTVADGACVAGKCGCSDGGSGQTCSSTAECFGPKWLCDCNICKGACASGKACTDDADCSPDGQTVVAGSCAIDPQQACYGLPAGGGTGGVGPCGTVSFEGQCAGKQLSYCDGTVKSQACGGCCGWDEANAFYNCLSGAVCNGCITECAAGQAGCSSEGTHAWTCANNGGCWQRAYTFCAKGCDAASKACKGGGGTVDKCPAGPDAGATDAVASDADAAAAGPEVDAGAADAIVTDGAGLDALADSKAGIPDAIPPADLGAADAPAKPDAADSGQADAAKADAAQPDSAPAEIASAEVAEADGSQNDADPDAGPPDATVAEADPPADTARQPRAPDVAVGQPDAAAKTQTFGGGASANGGLCAASPSGGQRWAIAMLLALAAACARRRRT